MRFHSALLLVFGLITIAHTHEGHDHGNESSPTSVQTGGSNKDDKPTASSEESSTSTEEPWTPIDPALQASLNKPKSISAEAYTPSKIVFSQSNSASAKSNTSNGFVTKPVYVLAVVPFYFYLQ